MRCAPRPAAGPAGVLVGVFAGALAGGLAGCGQPRALTPPSLAAQASGAAGGSFNCLQNPSVSYTLPADAALPDQDDMNCFAWQQFIALNWQASATQNGQPDTSVPASAFGQPSSSGASPATVWQTFALNSSVFRPGAAAPLPFSGAQAPRRLQATARRLAALGGGQTAAALSSIHQAFSSGWITAQNGRVTYYEIRLNADEYNYIVANKLYDARAQWQAVQSGAGIHLPDGSAPGTVGAIEVKAAWVPLTDPAQYTRFLTAQAEVVDPATGMASPAVVGLVGLHIIHKTQLAQQFVWATFEHVDNAPVVGAVGTGPYTYYNPACNPTTDPYKCALNTPPPACGASAGACNYAAPTQIARQQPIAANTAALNSFAQSAIRSANRNSVLQNYQLVSVMWPSSSTAVTGAPFAPLTSGNPQPPTGVGGLANTTLETYFQGTGAYSPNPSMTQPSCLACHTVATISSRGVPAGWRQPTNYASDYSFLFGEADAAPASPTTPTRRTP